ncbi:hypothetical protein PGTUg99_014291 [Puccinia graminis f. sp. tritici]|uniref:Uncharacterized protein n=1 Tax=Puccinia graminis f. sp. tritici TaxID=56615 RepID=A0A5B0SBV7_PUCGR|nr:hypothetical protein PGTUg99_014291 [Puccinia graminis f. sp. tritici]
MYLVGTFKMKKSHAGGLVPQSGANNDSSEAPFLHGLMHAHVGCFIAKGDSIPKATRLELSFNHSALSSSLVGEHDLVLVLVKNRFEISSAHSIELCCEKAPSSVTIIALGCGKPKNYLVEMVGLCRISVGRDSRNWMIFEN